MSNASDSEKPSDEITEETETILTVEPETTLALPPPPDSHQEDEWDHIPEQSNRNASSFPPCLYGTIPVILGIFSLLLLMCGFFGYQYFQAVQVSENKILKNLSQWIELIQKNVAKSYEFQNVINENKETLKKLENQNDYLIESLHELKTEQGITCGPTQHPSEQNRGFCYFQTQKEVPWLNCSDLCVSLKAEFLKTERSKLMIVTNLLAMQPTWLGLSYWKENREWTWEDGSTASPHLHLPEPKEEFEDNCVYVLEDKIGADDCIEAHSCMCEMALSETSL